MPALPSSTLLQRADARRFDVPRPLPEAIGRPAARPVAARRSALAGLLFPALVAAVAIGGLLVVQGRIDFSLAEEGFQWYGAVATAHGAVPLRDFYSYDPGRSYWAAAWSLLLGDGILALRASTAIFAAGGLLCGLLVARRGVRSRVGLALLGVALALWMVPRNKQFEPAIAMAAVLVAVRLLERPDARRCLAAGVTVGLALFFGKNHGLYLALAFLPLLAVAHARSDDRRTPGRLRTRLAAAGAGCALGALPLLVMLAAVPGFARAYLDSILFFLREGRTNFPLPVPWPWRLDLAGMSAIDRAQEIGASACYLLLPAVAVAAIALGLRAGRDAWPRRAPLLAAGAIGLVYLHHAFSRADLGHLAESAAPALLALVALPAALTDSRRRRFATAAVAVSLALLTAATVVPAAPLGQALTPETMDDESEPCDVSDTTLLLDHHTARLLRGFRRTIDRLVPAGEPILFAPCLPGLYPLLGRPSPVFDVYPIWSGPSDDRMLRELRQRDVRWALVQDYPMDGRDELRFSRTHPHTWAYLTSEFDRVSHRGLRLPGGAILLHKTQR
ncbi:MAG TPA: hypothetical protein VGE98_00095 [Thermoanaerobaculia bacterium]